MSLVRIMQRVVEQETALRRSSALAIVSAVFPHADENDENNYEINVQLKHEDLELRRVPIAVPHIGLVAAPKVGDLVLVQFVEGDLNQPVIIGRFYNDSERPPLHKEDEILFEHRVSDGTLNHLRFAADGSIILQRDVTKPEDNSEAKASIKIEGSSGDVQVKVGDDVQLDLKSDAVTVKVGTDVQLEMKSGKISINGDVEISGDLTVSNGSNRTKISGNSVEGS